MSQLIAPPGWPGPTLTQRTAQILTEQSVAGCRLVNRMFAVLLLTEWLAGIIVALVVSPTEWAGEIQGIHPHVWTALILGGLAVSLPVFLTLVRPGDVATRHCVAIGQMLLTALLIHLSGGRIEVHFLVFVSLAFLSLYYDWRVMVTASVVVAVDHFLRGVYWPRSIFGVAHAPWRWVEHSLWVVFEDVVLIVAANQSRGVMAESAGREAELEASHDRDNARTIELLNLNGDLHAEVEERRRIEGELRSSEEQFRTLAEALPQVVWGTDSHGSVDYFNRRWREYTGLESEQTLGNRWVEAIHPDDRAETIKAWLTAVTTGSPYQVEYRLRRADGSDRWHLGRGLPLRDEQGSILRWFGTCTDIDDQRQAAEALRRSHDELEVRVLERTAELEWANASLVAEVAERSKAEAEAHRSREVAELASRAKSEFLANMSHEIRTPMNAIIGMTDLTLGLDLDAKQRENLEFVQVAADSLLQLIDDILDFSKIEAGKLDMERAEFRLRNAVQVAERTLLLRASQKGLALTVEVAADVPETLIGDQHRLRQILLNLIGNAIKFTDAGRVDVRVQVERSDPDGIVLEFSVRDEGIGISADSLALIFDPFRQADGSMTRRFGGTGLGLSISSRLVELMGGRIWVESELGRGSTFRFTARFARAAPLAIPVPCACQIHVKPVARLRVLLVDDNLLNRRVGQGLLERIGQEVRLATDGPESIAIFESEGPFDLVLMDIQMPGMDGIEAAALIREVQKRQGRRCPIVALTAFAMKGDRERFLASGMDEHLAKPIRADDLARLLDQLQASGAREARGSEGE